MKLTILKESFDKFMSEVQITDEKTEALINEFGDLSKQLDELNKKVAELEKQQKEKLSFIHNELQETVDKILETKKYTIQIKRQGYTAMVPKYKEAFNLSLTKVNGAIKRILQEALKETEGTKVVAPQFSIDINKPNVSEDVNKIDLYQQEIDKANYILKQLSSQAIGE